MFIIDMKLFVKLSNKLQMEAELHDISFAHRHRDVRVRSSHIAGPAIRAARLRQKS